MTYGARNPSGGTSWSVRRIQGGMGGRYILGRAAVSGAAARPLPRQRKKIAMCFEQLYESSKRNELLLIDGGMCHWHLRRDGQLTIREIIGTRRGAGAEMLNRLKRTSGASCIVAKCPADLDSNAWYQRRGFVLDHAEQAKSGRTINVWRLELV